MPDQGCAVFYFALTGEILSACVCVRVHECVCV